MTSHTEKDVAEIVERCAQIAEAIGQSWIRGEATTLYGQAYQAACGHIAEAVRNHLISTPDMPKGGEA